MDIQPYLDRVYAEFPDTRGLPFRMPPQGMDHVAIIVGEDWIYRFPKLPEYVDRFPKEIRALDALHARIDLPIPHYERVAKDRSFGGYRLIRGAELTAREFDPLPAAVKDAIASELALFLSQLHAVTPAEAKALGVPRNRGRKKWLAQQREWYKQHLEPELSDEDRARCDRYYAEIGKLPDRMPRETLIHGDLGWWHILLSEKKDGLAGIIDFGDRSVSDPSSDFSALHLYGPDFVRNVYGRYAGPKDDTFLHRARLGFTYVGISEMLHAIRGTFGTREAALPVFRKAMDMPF
jgi:aminoglycoside 2''-phosphotransferase